LLTGDGRVRGEAGRITATCGRASCRSNGPPGTAESGDDSQGSERGQTSGRRATQATDGDGTRSALPRGQAEKDATVERQDGGGTEAAIRGNIGDGKSSGDH